MKERNKEPRNDNRKVNVRAIGIFAFGFVLFTVASILMLNRLWQYSEARGDTDQTPTAPLNVDTAKLPPGPRLQDHAVRDLQQMRAAEDQVLNSYHWIDRRKGLVRIPIDRAIDLLAQGRQFRNTVRRTANDFRSLSSPAETDRTSVDSAAGPSASASDGHAGKGGRIGNGETGGN